MAACPDDDPIAPPIMLSDMIQRREIRTVAEDWTGTTDSARRRKLQNRLNQRAYERRKTCLKRAKVSKLQPGNETKPQWCRVTDGTMTLEILSSSPILQKLEAANGRKPAARCALLQPGVLGALVQFVQKAYEDYILGHPQPWQLSTIIQVNILNALIRNGLTLGISGYWQRERAMSLFSGENWSRVILDSCPPSLQPTSLQLTVPHSAWIDLFPFPQMRDNILREYSRVDTDELCADLLDIRPGLEGKANLIVWGDAADPRGWEASSYFLRKWGWMLWGCGEVLDATNYWRQRRGEDQFVF
ncbi:unnamed protein product [Clonostachys chloroleuca]|uniref:BZIP domain-containing protein n=1 Tax=Clonostachys chloroleuca TaxID=1926264 RepID=A0AA35PXD3_9HYPO|nr:unnamed protein product [Clonostachys chloroleuca]